MFLIFGNDAGSSAKISKGDALNESFRISNLLFPFETQQGYLQHQYNTDW